MSDGNDYDGTFIAVEGLDGSGKSTAIDGIESWAETEDSEIVCTSEPYIDLEMDDETAPLVEFSSFMMDRRLHLEEVIIPNLEDGNIVVTDRYMGSTLAYQPHRIAAETDMSVEEARSMIETVSDDVVEPDVTIYIDVSVETALDRCDCDNDFERRETLAAAKEMYDEMYSNCDNNVRIINGEQSKSAVRHTAINVVQTKLVTANESSADDGKLYADRVTE